MQYNLTAEEMKKKFKKWDEDYSYALSTLQKERKPRFFMYNKLRSGRYEAEFSGIHDTVIRMKSTFDEILH